MRVLTTIEAEELYGIPAATFATWCEEGKFRNREILPHQDENGLWQIYDLAIEDFLDLNPAFRTLPPNFVPATTANAQPAKPAWQRKPTLVLALLFIAAVGVLLRVRNDEWRGVGRLFSFAQLPAVVVTPTPKEMVILITTFETEMETGASAPHLELKHSLEEELTRLGEEHIRVAQEAILLAADEREEAEALGKRYNADVVIWGEILEDEVLLNYSVLGPSDFSVGRVTSSSEQNSEIVVLSGEDISTQNFAQQLPFFTQYTLAQTYYLQGNNNKAVAAFEQAAALMTDELPNSTRARTYWYLGRIYSEAEETVDLAINDYTKAIELWPDYPAAYNGRGYLYDWQGDYARALQDYDRVIELDATYDDVYASRGRVYEMLDEEELAFEDYDNAVQVNPDYFGGYYGRCRIYLDQGRLEEALADCNQAILLSPIATNYYVRGSVYYELDRWDEAFKDYDQAIQLDDTYADAYYGRGAVHTVLGRVYPAIDDYSRAIELDPTNDMAYYERCRLKKELLQWDEAVADCSQAIVLAPDDADYYGERCYLYINQDLFEEALKDCNKSLQLSPNDPALYTYRGFIYANLDRFQAAIWDYDRALEIDPTLEEVKQYREEVYRKLGN